jgi:hypothetical protein
MRAVRRAPLFSRNRDHLATPSYSQMRLATLRMILNLDQLAAFSAVRWNGSAHADPIAVRIRC